MTILNRLNDVYQDVFEDDELVIELAIAESLQWLAERYGNDLEDQRWTARLKRLRRLNPVGGWKCETVN